MYRTWFRECGDYYVKIDLKKVYNQIRVFMESILPPGSSIGEAFATSAVYEFRNEKPGALARIFAEVEAGAVNIFILEYGISQSSLDEVFTRVTMTDEMSVNIESYCCSWYESFRAM
ncbi:hypothetical protein SeMB42_g01739 [Synchytrium endobioticum]|uniref:Uncharacterized protein n=1 Tax=Synchytrium endobioticum TaxID=286115 RepID=A0A507DK14_9FUNG|nr:hypothetical protein SeLEV6574_g01664 [Synchytrium endobioticum]TPX51963.1 hypothetical protein SeMB42_g01739 [Synchytrium endobioticum]